MASIINASATGVGGVVTTADASGVLNLQSNGVTMASVSSSGFNLGSGTPSISTALSPYTGFKNRIINGAMVIDQRNAGASVTPTDGQYTIDRWMSRLSQASKYTVQQNAGSVTPPAGFNNYIGVTSSSSYSVTSTDYFSQQYRIEGFNLADLGWGAAGAQTITISFWVRSSLTGTFGGSIANGAADRCYVFSYTINSANTWEQKSITIAGDTSGTWLKTNGIGMFLSFGYGQGSTTSASAGSWLSSFYSNVTGAVSVVGTNGATFYITGVQLEVGSQATSFEYRDYGRELILCQRYFQAVAFNIYVGNTGGFYWSVPISYPKMRVAPTFGALTGGSSSNITGSEIIENITSYGCRFTILASGNNANSVGKTSFASAEL